MYNQKLISNEHNNHFEYNLQPPAGILNVFSRLSYKPEYAIAEFVDNSTQSYLLHQDELEVLVDDFVMKVEIDYLQSEKILIIKDNAYGMNRERFLDAITLDAKNNNQVNSRNEFGMGLKTAASWFGNIWTVESTELGSTEKYSATVNIPYLSESGENNVDIDILKARPDEHGTKIVIQELTKGMGGRSIEKIKTMLASMYRRDLATGKIKISYNDKPIEFEPYPILFHQDKKWKKDLDFTFEFNGKNFRVTGFVAIMDPGGHSKAGFALFRRNRVVYGGEGRNYKPYEIFSQSGSQVGLKLFGELNLDDFPVNQAKDGFIWDDGLQDTFIEVLRNNIRDYIALAKISKKERALEDQYSEAESKRVHEAVSISVEKSNNNAQDAPLNDLLDYEITEDEREGFAAQNEDVAYVVQQFTEAIANTGTNSDFESSERSYELNINEYKSVKFHVSWVNHKNGNWLEIVENEPENAKVFINVDHPFFKPFVNDINFKITLEKLVLAIAAAEIETRELADERGYVPSVLIRQNMNSFLKRLAQ